ncbi:IS3 family transposase [Desulfosediminicola ganghwensis]|uniref:IS3 family transposase n=1 Tax=Desulfosediminicola ganghwensis TaxID=2569540 RepID=UPI0010AB9D68
MRLIDRIHLADPTIGPKRMSKYFRRVTGIRIGRKRVLRLMGIEAIYPRRQATIPGKSSYIYPISHRKLVDSTAQPGMGRRYHLGANEKRFCVSLCHN